MTHLLTPGLGLAAALAVVLAACDAREADRPADPAAHAAPASRLVATPSLVQGLILEAGDSLFDHLQRLRVARHPPSSLPPGVAQRLRALLVPMRWTLGPDAWFGGGTVASGDGLPEALGVDGELLRWRARTPVRLDLPLGPLRLHHEGRPLDRAEPAEGTSEAPLAWADFERDGLFVWDADNDVLLAFGTTAPGSMEFAFPDVTVSDLARAEWRLAGGRDAPADGRALLWQGDALPDRRPALLAPAPTELVLQADRILARELVFAVGTLDLGVERRGERLVGLSDLGDGVTLAIEVDCDGRRERVWSRHLPGGADWVSDVIDLTPYDDRPLTLHFLTEGGPTGDTWGDYALWSDLHVRGRRQDVRAEDG